MKSFILSLGVLFILMIQVEADQPQTPKNPVLESQEPILPELAPDIPNVPPPPEQKEEKEKTVSVIYTSVLLRTDKYVTVVAVSTHELKGNYNATQIAEDYLEFDIKRRNIKEDVKATLTIKSLIDPELLIIILRYGGTEEPPPRKKVAPPPVPKKVRSGIVA